MQILRVGMALVAVTMAAHASEPRAGEVERWHLSGPDGGKPLAGHGYEGGIDRTQSHSGRASAFLRAVAERPDIPNAVVWQSISSERYRGKRVRLSGWVKTEGAHVARFGMKVASAGESNLAYGAKEVTGSSEWRRYEVVLDVSPLAQNITFGLLLEAPGAAWLDEVRLEIVDERTPTTNQMPPAPLEPENLDFEQ